MWRTAIYWRARNCSFRKMVHHTQFFTKFDLARTHSRWRCAFVPCSQAKPRMRFGPDFVLSTLHTKHSDRNERLTTKIVFISLDKAVLLLFFFLEMRKLNRGILMQNKQIWTSDNSRQRWGVISSKSQTVAKTKNCYPRCLVLHGGIGVCIAVGQDGRRRRRRNGTRGIFCQLVLSFRNIRWPPAFHK